MIPKIIHYCWLSDEEYPEKIKKCIESWQKYLPDYKFVKWDFTRINKSDFKWISDAFDNKKYAFAADYIRVYALYHYGGIYLDSDVEVLKSFNDLLQYPYFMSYEHKSDAIEAAILGSEKGNPLFKILIDYYNEQDFIKANGMFNEIPIPTLMKQFISQRFKSIPIQSPIEIKRDNSTFFILPSDYFSPKSYLDGKLHLTSNSYSIHHYNASWLPKYYQIEQQFWRILKCRNLKILTRIVNLFKHGTIRTNIG